MLVRPPVGRDRASGARLLGSSKPLVVTICIGGSSAAASSSAAARCSFFLLDNTYFVTRMSIAAAAMQHTVPKVSVANRWITVVESSKRKIKTAAFAVPPIFLFRHPKTYSSSHPRSFATLRAVLLLPDAWRAAAHRARARLSTSWAARSGGCALNILSRRRCSPACRPSRRVSTSWAARSLFYGVGSYHSTGRGLSRISCSASSRAFGVSQVRGDFWRWNSSGRIAP